MVFWITHDAGFAVAVAYPNPGKDVLNIRTALENARLEVYDLHGRLMHSQRITDNVATVDAAAWPAGTYVWNVISNDKKVEKGKWVRK